VRPSTCPLRKMHDFHTMSPRAVLIALLAMVMNEFATAAPVWTPAGDRLKTRFAGDVIPDQPLTEYPRPQLMRDRWTNLNGIWSYAVTAPESGDPADFPGQILVPFPVESSLSGVGHSVGMNNVLWYRRTFSATPLQGGERLLLNFGAVNWETEVYINGQLVGSHRGGYDPFTFDISAALNGGSDQTVVVRVSNPANGQIPRGKQSLNPKQIFYMASTGIWQTVWTEIVPEDHITNLKIVPDINHECVLLAVDVTHRGNQPVSAQVLDGEGHALASQTGSAGNQIRIDLSRPKLWSPEEPNLYRILVHCGEDAVESYFGMRSVLVAKDDDGINRVFLNGKPCFLFGLLDQGYWPDGLYTAPSDRALRYDLERTKAWGFNTVRKHMKVEPERWYYWADKLGIMVWQDFPAVTDVLLKPGAEDKKRTKSAATDIETEMRSMVKNLANHPSIVGWIPFNEGWGQFDTIRIANLFKALDPTRLVDDASGWIDRGAGDVSDQHSYPQPSKPLLEPNRVCLQGEYGGGGLLVKDHVWDSTETYQYARFETPQELLKFFTEQADTIVHLKRGGLAGAIYTQTTDVESEINGLMTYDRIPKIETEPLREVILRTISDP
jgi:beta-galactosidase/beta-glucuronidase